MKYIVILFVFIVVLFLLFRDAPFYFQSKSLPGYSRVNKDALAEAFEDAKKGDKLPVVVESPLLSFQPGSGEPVDLHDGQPYHLLKDEMGMPREKESLSCVNSRSCYATDFQRILEKAGSFRQLTNNYKRGYPDSCSGTNQELVLNFYKAYTM